MKASQCDSWYSACSEDLFCVGESTHFFDTPGDGMCNQETDCKKFKDIYANASDFCEILWDGAFTYEVDEANAYSFVFPEGHANPNDVILPNTGKLHPSCQAFTSFVMNDIQINATVFCRREITALSWEEEFG